MKVPTPEDLCIPVNEDEAKKVAQQADALTEAMVTAMRSYAADRRPFPWPFSQLRTPMCDAAVVETMVRLRLAGWIVEIDGQQRLRITGRADR